MKDKLIAISFMMLSLTCLAIVVRSVNGAVHSRFSSVSDESVTAKDYIQDGLIGHWDGIENAGYGQHRDDAESWENLADYRYPFVLMEYGYWCESGWVNGGDIANMRSHSPYGYLTCEIVMTPSSTYHSNSIRKVLTVRPTGRSSRSLFIDSTSQNVSGYSTRSVPCAHFPFKVNGVAVSCSFVFSSAGDDAEIIDAFACGERSMHEGNITWSSNIYESKGGGSIIMAGDDTNNGSGDMVIHSLRLYDRQLSKEEISYNHEIDKVRFNVP